MRRALVLGISLAVALVFMFLVPVAQMTSSNPPTQTCTNSSGQLTGFCSTVLIVRGYGSITYWLFGTGGFYNIDSSQYGFG